MLRLITGTPAVILSLIIATLIVWVALFCKAIYRTQLGRRCWYCGAPKVRISRSKQNLDLFARLSLLFPYRCAGCLKRFYRLRVGGL